MNELLVSALISLVSAGTAYLKVKSERSSTKKSRDVEMALMSQKIENMDKQLSVVEELKTSINTLTVSMARIETILTMYMKQQDRSNREDRE